MSFDRLAPHYTWMEKLLAGGKLQRCRLAWLESLAGCERILNVGVGHGHFMRRCALRFPTAQITAVDASAGMLREAERRSRASGVNMERLTFIHASLPDCVPPAGTFDAIATHFFLDCFEPAELREVVARLAQGAKPRACWLNTDFAVPERGLARRRAQFVHGLMYGFFRRITAISARRVIDPSPWLTAAGFQLTGRETAEWGLLQADRWERNTAS